MPLGERSLPTPKPRSPLTNSAPLQTETPKQATAPINTALQKPPSRMLPTPKPATTDSQSLLRSSAPDLAKNTTNSPPQPQMPGQAMLRASTSIINAKTPVSMATSPPTTTVVKPQLPITPEQAPSPSTLRPSTSSSGVKTISSPTTASIINNSKPQTGVNNIRDSIIHDKKTARLSKGVLPAPPASATAHYWQSLPPRPNKERMVIKDICLKLNVIDSI